MNATHVVANLFPGAILQLCANLHQGAIVHINEALDSPRHCIVPWATRCDFQQYILTSVDSGEPLHPLFKPRASK